MLEMLQMIEDVSHQVEAPTWVALEQLNSNLADNRGIGLFVCTNKWLSQIFGPCGSNDGVLKM